MRKRPIVALLYDFDKTLCNEDMQNYAFIPHLNMTPSEFWSETEKFGEKENMERILAYMYMMVSKAKAKGIHICTALSSGSNCELRRIYCCL